MEKRIASNLIRIETRGKKGRKVAILLTEKMQYNIELLIKNNPNNPYIFFNNTSNKYIRGSDILRKLASDPEANIENPQHLRSTNFRKHIATISQILNLKENELDILADFLGHDIRTHRDFYRLPEDTIQLAKVSKLLISLEKGNVSKLKGKSLDEINEIISSESDEQSSFESKGKFFYLVINNKTKIFSN